jgi:membrane-associated phospholipid phosphatase
VTNAPPRDTATSRRVRVRVVSMLVYAAALGTWSVLVGLPKQTLTAFLWIWLAAIAWNIRAPWRSHLAFPRDWWPVLAVMTLYLWSRGMADELGATVHVIEPIRADRALFGGALPTEFLQAHLCGLPCDHTSPPQWYDVLLTTVYYSFFFLPFVVAAVLWLRDRASWVAFMRRYLALNLVALIVYVTYPMAPPWMAEEDGFITSNIDRITSRGWWDLGEVGIHQQVSALSNQVAAMPSLHAAMALFLAAYGIGRLRSPWRWLLLLYPVAMGLALVYFAEHYAVDILAGGVLTGVVLMGSAVWERRRARVPSTASP